MEHCIANGAMCKFKGIILKDDLVPQECFEPILIDGYYVNSVQASCVKLLVVEMIDGNSQNMEPRLAYLQTQKICATVRFPIAWDGPISKKTQRINRRIKFEQFPVSIANAITVHKLQGRSLKNVVVSLWNYTGNWVYVILSRCSTLKGIYLRKPLLKTRPMSEKCQLFHKRFRNEKQPNKKISQVLASNYVYS